MKIDQRSKETQKFQFPPVLTSVLLWLAISDPGLAPCGLSGNEWHLFEYVSFVPTLWAWRTNRLVWPDSGKNPVITLHVELATPAAFPLWGKLAEVGVGHLIY